MDKYCEGLLESSPATFMLMKEQTGRLYHVRYNIGGMSFQKYKILTTNLDGRSVKIVIPENDAINL